MRALALCLVIAVLLPMPIAAGARPKVKRPISSAPDLAYVSALAVANHFLRSWQTGDIETGIMLLSDGARRQSSEDRLREYFSAAMQRGFEIQRGNRIRAGRYSFPIALIEQTDDHRIRRKQSAIVVSSTGKLDWAVVTLP